MIFFFVYKLQDTKMLRILEKMLRNHIAEKFWKIKNCYDLPWGDNMNDTIGT